MKKVFGLIALLSFMFIMHGLGHAWKFNTHKNSVIHAFNYLETNGNAIQKWTASFLKYAGGSDIATLCGNKNGDTDNFYDTSIGGWWVGYRTHVSVLGFDTNFTSFWHFVTMFRPGHYNNAYDGYSYRYSLEDGFWGYNGVIKSLLYNQDTRNSGKAGNNISYPEYGKGVRDAYRFRFQTSSSSKYSSTTPGGNYDDYQDTIFEPCTNAAAYWYDRALYGRTSTNADRTHISYLGHVFHMAGDANVTQHVWDTSDHYHVDYEGWMDSRFASLLNAGKVTQLINAFKAAYGITSDDQLANVTIQQVMSFFASRAVNLPGPLYSEDGTVRNAAGYEEYNGSVAVNAIILVKYVHDLYVASTARKY